MVDSPNTIPKMVFTFLSLLLLTSQTSGSLSDDVDPAVLGGNAKSSIRFRINSNGFDYANELLAPLLSQQIRSLKIPRIEQCIDEIDGCIVVEQVTVTEYDCPERIEVKPRAPKDIVVTIQNLNLALSGNMAGRINVTKNKVPLVGSATAAYKGVNIIVGISLVKTRNNKHAIKITQCQSVADTVDVTFQNAGSFQTIMDDAVFKSRIDAQLQKIGPRKVCELLPQIVEKDINRHLRQFPNSVSITDIVKMFKEMVLPLLKSKFECPASCATGKSAENCEECGKVVEGVELAKSLGRSLDLSKLDKVEFDYSIVQVKSSDHDLTVNMKGEFSPKNRSTPFKPFATKFPLEVGNRMAEVLLSDHTINSLFYWLHNVGFINITLDSDAPVIGGILKTTCGDDEDAGDLSSVEVDEEVPVMVKREADSESHSESSIADLGICFGDILPKIREEHPNENLTIIVTSSRAPAVIFDGKDGGSATTRISAEAAIHISSTGDRVGRVAITFEAVIQIQTTDGNLTGTANVTTIVLKDVDQSLGLPQDALDSLAQLAIDFLNKALNDVLEKGVNVHLPSAATGLPVSLLKPNFSFVDHALHIDGDVEIDAKSFAELVGQKGIKADQCKSTKQ